MKVMTIVGTRPEIIKMALIIKELDIYTDHILVHTGQNYDYELNEIFFNELGIRRPDHFLEAAKGSAVETIGNVIIKSDEVMGKEKPDALLVYGDTNSCLCVISAKRRKIPIFHMEAGNRCFDQRVPEEINRKIVDHLSDINLPLSEHARNYLISEGIPAERIIKSGSTLMEVLNYYNDKIENSNVLEQLDLKPQNYFVFSAHREENIDLSDNFQKLMISLNKISEKFNRDIIFSTHPRTMKKIKELKSGELNKHVKIMKPLGYFDYIKLQKNAFCVISDSGTITEESSILNFPAITIRQSHERPEGMDQGTLIMTGLEYENVLESIKIVTDQYEKNKEFISIVPDYNVPFVSKKIVRIIFSYVDYINRNIWSKE